MKMKRSTIGISLCLLLIACLATADRNPQEAAKVEVSEKESVKLTRPGQSLRRLLPRSGEIEGLMRGESPKTYIPENLWEYINGAAEPYLSYGFRKLVAAEYSPEGDEIQTITLDIYDMGEPDRGFGIYSLERNSDYQFTEIGTQAFYDEISLNFFKGRYYVKISTFDVSDQLQKFMKSLASKVSAKIHQPLSYPEELEIFSLANRVKNSERLIAKSFLGQPRFDNVYTVDYKIEAVTYTLFYSKFESSEEASSLYVNLQRQNASFTSPLRNLTIIGEQAFQVVTKYHKGLVLARQGSVVFGGYNTAYPDEVLTQMQKMKIQ